MRLPKIRPPGAYSKVQRAIGGIVRNRVFQYRRASTKGKALLNVGCGSNVVSDFINLDYDWRPGLDICCDIRRGILLPDGSLDGIFTEHCLEHISFPECLMVLRDFHRLLVKDGTVRIVVPDGGLYLQLYAQWQAGEPHPDFPYVGVEGVEDRARDSLVGFTPMMAVNRIFRGYGHQFCYDYETLQHMLTYTGFVRVEKRSFREGRAPALLIDSDLRRPQSLYVEATKE